ncbi:hypothetical protein POTOM_017093 [Populus tomentosa]|uniref:Uncharacterized protein n=1 Tax=Populus tomentosa TaxID=118781 RepID=A0A8X8CVF0_POPTO|nr:hypothetical protein POTOM_017093 [Populus tomentosa]
MALSSFFDSASVMSSLYPLNPLPKNEAQSECYTDDTIKGLILFADVITKAREDLETEFVQERLVEESDSSKIIYLQHTIFENLRLYPVVPLLASHMSSAELAHQWRI